MKVFVRNSLLLAVIVAVAGCASMRPIPPARLDLPPNPPLLVGDEPDYARHNPEAATAPRVETDLVKPGSGVFINRQAASAAPEPKAAVGDVSFNFEGESLHAVIKAILGDILQENYVIAPGVQGNVTFSTAKPLKADQALSILEMLLRWNNATLVWENGRYTILPIAQAVPGNLTPRLGSPRNARGYEVRAVPLEFISAVEMEKVLKPYAKPEAVINVDPARNMIVLGGTQAELANYLQTVQIFDVDWLAGMSVGVFSLQQAEAAKVVGELEKIFGEGSNTPLAGMFRFIPLEGVNGVMVITPQPKYLATIESWLERFDLGSGQAGQRLYVYDVKNTKAQDLADTLSDIFGGGGNAGRATRTSGTVAPGLEPVEIRSVGSNSTRVGQPLQQQQAAAAEPNGGTAGPDVVVETGPGGGVVDGAGGISIGATEEVRISAVEESNALLVRATSGQWESIRRVIDRLDQIPLQVAIDAQIVRVALNEELTYGVQWFFENSVPDDLSELAASRNSFSSLGGAFGGGLDGALPLGWSFVGDNAVAIIEALDSASDVTVLSAPTIVVLNNKEAAINVGTQIPVQSTSIVNPIGGGNTQPITSFQYLQTGITLQVTPRVNPGGLVFLEISQEESEPGAPVANGNRQIDSRTIQTSVAIQSGQTVMLGGLIKQTDSGGSAGVPFLSRIPVLGGLFGRDTSTSNREELLVLITPRVIRDPGEARRVTEEYKTRFRGLQPLLPAPTVIVD